MKRIEGRSHRDVLWKSYQDHFADPAVVKALSAKYYEKLVLALQVEHRDKVPASTTKPDEVGAPAGPALAEVRENPEKRTPAQASKRSTASRPTGQSAQPASKRPRS